MKAGIIILAAGESSRMGEPKQLLEFQGVTLLARAIATALEISDARVAVVLGANAVRVRGQIDVTRVLVVENPDWQEGMGTSIRAGMSALLEADPELATAIFLTCDQPLLTKGILAELISTHHQNRCPITASEYDGTLGVPALFDRALFPELLALDGAIGAKRIIMNHRNQVIGIPFPEGAIDIDTPADFLNLSRECVPTVPVGLPGSG